MSGQRYGLAVIVRCVVVCFSELSIAGDLQSVNRSLGSLFTRTLGLYFILEEFHSNPCASIVTSRDFMLCGSSGSMTIPSKKRS